MMECLIYYFPISGVKTYIFLPPLVMFVISSVVSMGGVSGAFILLPFQISVLGYTAPGVSATNFVYNIVSIPSGIYRHIKRRQISWALFWIIIAGTIPGILIGYYIRVLYLPDPAKFKIFAGVVLGLLGIRTIQSAWDYNVSSLSKDLNNRKLTVSISKEKVGLLKSEIYSGSMRYEFSTLFLALISFIVGVVGAIYGIGGGAILAPFCMSVLELPVYIVSGAALFSTWINSIIGACTYALMSYKTGIDAYPDWQLGVLFGVGGLIGIYVGSFLQMRVPDRIIKSILGAVLLFISARYLKGIL